MSSTEENDIGSIIPRHRVASRLNEHDNIVITSESGEQISFVLVQKNFHVLQHISRILDTFDMEVEKKMWVDEGEKVYLQPR